MAKLEDLKALLDAARAKRDESREGGHEATRHSAYSMRSVAHRPVPATAAGAPASDKRHVNGHSPRRALGASKHADGDIDLAQAFADVTRLPPTTRATIHRAGPAPVPRQRLADDRDALLASKYGDEPTPSSWDIGQEVEGEQTFVRRGVGSDVLGKLRRHHWVVQSEIDLHGNTSDEARDALADFLHDARQRGFRCVRVIHGKGLTSHNREPVLKGKVRRWLSHWDDVLAYCEAPQHAGGGGAVLVLLRGR
jgi:DNA-nicking Smr family endonuclease